MTKVSVIIPAYNASKTIERAIKSVWQNNLNDIEVIVINDGSSDDTSKKVTSLLKAHPALRLVNTDNLGVSAARNRGAAESRGELLAFLDADDEWLPGKIDFQLPKFNNPRVGLVYGDCFVDRGGKRVLWSSTNTMLSGRPVHELTKENFIPTLTVMLRKESFQKVGGFDKKIKYGEDYDLWWRIVVDGWEIDFVKNPLAIYYFGVGVGEGFIGRYEEYLNIYHKWQKTEGLDIPAKKIISKKLKFYQGLNYREKFILSFKKKDFKNASSFAWKRWVNSPLKVKFLVASVFFKLLGLLK